MVSCNAEMKSKDDNNLHVVADNGQARILRTIHTGHAACAASEFMADFRAKDATKMKLTVYTALVSDGFYSVPEKSDKDRFIKELKDGAEVGIRGIAGVFDATYTPPQVHMTEVAE